MEMGMIGRTNRFPLWRRGVTGGGLACQRMKVGRVTFKKGSKRRGMDKLVLCTRSYGISPTDEQNQHFFFTSFALSSFYF